MNDELLIVHPREPSTGVGERLKGAFPDGRSEQEPSHQEYFNPPLHPMDDKASPWRTAGVESITALDEVIEITENAWTAKAETPFPRDRQHKNPHP